MITETMYILFWQPQRPVEKARIKPCTVKKVGRNYIDVKMEKTLYRFDKITRNHKYFLDMKLFDTREEIDAMLESYALKQKISKINPDELSIEQLRRISEVLEGTTNDNSC